MTNTYKLNNISVRPAEFRDLERITEIYRNEVLTGTGTFEIEPPDFEEMRRRFDEVRARNGFWIVAIFEVEKEACVVGYAYAAPFHYRAAYRYALENSIYVAHDFQRQGIGKLLLRHLIEEAKSRSFRHMIAVIGDSGNLGSIELHRAMGFGHAGLLRGIGFKHDRWLDVVYMQINLSVNQGSTVKDNE